MGLVGESGSGKTTIGRTIVRLYKPTAGQIMFGDKDMAPMGGEELRQLRRRVQMIFQDPFASLNPRFTIGSLIAEPMHIYRIGSNKEIRESTVELLRVVGCVLSTLIAIHTSSVAAAAAHRCCSRPFD